MLGKEIYLLLPYKVASGTSSDLTQAGLPSKCTFPPSFVGANPGATALLPDDLDVHFSTVFQSASESSAAQWFSISFCYNMPNRFQAFP